MWSVTVTFTLLLLLSHLASPPKAPPGLQGVRVRCSVVGHITQKDLGTIRYARYIGRIISNIQRQDNYSIIITCIICYRIYREEKRENIPLKGIIIFQVYKKS